ncbi:MAG: T9SS type A sorting domain-containing protein [Flavobacteriales bacterium]|nr:T9SS type A sorting domain-containing protein [Flavobacteriales bacterium]
MNRIATLLLMVTLGTTQAFAQDGALDLSFNPMDEGMGNGDAALYEPDVRAIAVQTDGRMLVGGGFGSFEGSTVKRMVRVLPDGSVDPSFTLGFLNSGINAIVVQPNGKILVGGVFYQAIGSPYNHIVRLNADGSVDASFNPGVGPDFDVNTIALQPDGKVVIGGAFTSFNGLPRNHIARLNANGTLDTGFNPNAAPPGEVHAVVVDGNDKIWVGGEFAAVTGTTHKSIVRYNPDGSVDVSFNAGTGVTVGVSAIGRIRSMCILPDQRMMIGGGFSSYNGTIRNSVTTLLPDGSMDPAFTGSGPGGSVYAVAVQPDSLILVAGDFGTYNGQLRNDLARIYPDGTVDPTLVSGGEAVSTIRAVAPLADGKMMIGGDFLFYDGLGRYAVTRLHNDGSWDNTFGPGTGANLSVLAVAPLNDGKLLVGGAFTLYNGEVARRVIRLNADGTLDPDFGPVGEGCGNNVEAIVVQPDGRILIAGFISSFDGLPRLGIARLNADGALDPSLDPGLGTDGAVHAMALQPDGRIIIAGTFNNYNGTARKGIARILPDGTLDTSFDPGTGVLGGVVPSVYSLALQPDSSVVIAGAFTSFNGTTRNNIARLAWDGSVDLSFDPGAGPNLTVRSVQLQPDQRIIIGGDFTSYSATQRKRVARLNPDGSLDASFNSANGANSYVMTCLLQGDGKVIIGGEFDHYGGAVRGNVARVNADGSLDSSFNTGIGAEMAQFSTSSVMALATQTGGALIIGGQFHKVNGVGRNRIARLNNTFVGVEEQAADEGVLILPNPARDHLTIQLNDRWSGAEIHITLFDLLGNAVLQQRSSSINPTIDTGDLAPGTYVLRLTSGSTRLMRKVVIG